MTVRLFFLLLPASLLLSCSVNKNQPVNDYFTDNIINNKEEDVFYKDKIRDSSIWILKEKANKKRALTFVDYSYFWNPATEKRDLKFDKSALYNANDWNRMLNEYTKDTVRGNWDQKDFAFQTKIISAKELNKIWLTAPTDYKDREKVYSVSDVMYYQNKKYAVFEVLEFSNLFGGSDYGDALIFMENKNGKWVLIEKIFNDTFSNSN